MELRASAGLAVSGSARWLISKRRHLYEQRGIRFTNLELSKKCPDSRLFQACICRGVENFLTARDAVRLCRSSMTRSPADCPNDLEQFENVPASRKTNSLRGRRWLAPTSPASNKAGGQT